MRSFYLCLFFSKPRPSPVSLESPGLGNIPQVQGNRAKVDENHDARNAVSGFLSVLKWSGALFRPRSSKVSVQKGFLCPFDFKPRLSGVNLGSPGVENIPQVPGSRAQVGQNNDARKAVSAPLSVWKWSGSIFRPRSSKPSVQKVFLRPLTANQINQELLLCPRDWKISPSSGKWSRSWAK